MSNKPTDLNHAPVELEPMDMHGPIEVNMFIHVMLPDGKNAKLRFMPPAGQIPMPEDFQDFIDAAGDPAHHEASGMPAGVRLLTKPEFVALITKRETGQAMQLPGEQHFVPCEPQYAIPRQMLIHAIYGAGIPSMQLACELVERGLTRFAGNQHNERWEFTHTVEKLDDDALANLYAEITAGPSLANMPTAGSC